MSSVIDRTLMAQIVIVLAVCIGAWFVFVEPRAVEAQLLEEEIQAGSVHAEAVDQTAVQRLTVRLDEVRSRVRQIERRGEIARDSSHLYSVVMDLARAHEITVASLSPGAASNRSGARSSRRSGPADEPLVVQRGFAVSISGRYADIAQFVDALQSLGGYIEVEYLSVAAASGRDDALNARLTCRTIQFTLPESLQNIVGRKEGDEIAIDSLEATNESAGGQDDA